MFEKELQFNSNHVNSLIIPHILSDSEMRAAGFSDNVKDKWYYCKQVEFPKEKRYKGFEITFNITIPKDGSDINIDVLDEDFLQPYDYQYMLSNHPNFEPAKITFEFVEKQMEFLQNIGILSGHVYGEYI